jgi:antitoxin (DNA-binding transcriptional repressor) of toxin-antitoxin stability system
MSKIIGLKDFRINADSYINQIKAGKSFVVVKRSRPVFQISPVIDEYDDGAWSEVIDFTKLNAKKTGINAKKLIEILKQISNEPNKKVSC